MKNYKIQTYEQFTIKPPIYTALFVDKPYELIQLFHPAYTNVFAHHSTIQFGKCDMSKITIGKKHKIKVLGLARDEKTDAILVENPLSTNKYPHITLSTAQGIKPFYVNELITNAVENNKIIYFDQPYEIDVTEGYFNGRDIVE